MGPTPAAWLAEKPFTLVLGAGFFGFYAHTGVLLALEERGLVPARVVGVSAGSLAGGLWAGGLSGLQLERELRRLRRADFWDPGLPLGGLLKGRKFAGMLDQLLGPGRDLQDVRVPLATVAHDVLGRGPVVLDAGPMGPAIVASCTVPLMFRPVRHGGRWLVDGGVSDRNGLVATAPHERVLLHHLPSRSPWRGLTDARRGIPSPGANRIVLALSALPRVSPGRLDRGPIALREAHLAAGRWLDRPLELLADRFG